MTSVGTASAENAMTVAELRTFLAEPRTARLATLRADGDVHLTPIWFMHEADSVRFCLEQRRLHLTNLRRHPRATLLVDVDERPANGMSAPTIGAMFSGSVELVDETETVEAFRGRLRQRYRVPVEDADVQAGTESELQYVLVILRVERSLTWDFAKG